MNIQDIIARAEEQRRQQIAELEGDTGISHLEPQRGTVRGYKFTADGEQFLVAAFTPAGEAGYRSWGFYSATNHFGTRVYEGSGDITSALLDFRRFYLLPRREKSGN